MKVVFRWMRLFVSGLLFSLFILAAFYHRTSVYLIHQAWGQLSVVFNTQSIDQFRQSNQLSRKELENLELVERIKKYSVDSLGYLPTGNFTTVFNQKNAAILWVITACKPFAFQPYEWYFPLVGTVSYKGFFKKELAEKEYNHLVCLGYDVDLRSVSAWSTLGWLNDPLLSSMLTRSKGGLCNLLFHELFHATYYAPNAVDLNENLASFVAHKATMQFLQNDTVSLREYCDNYRDNERFTQFMLRQTLHLEEYYKTIATDKNRQIYKLKALLNITDSLEKLGLRNQNRFLARKEQILKSKNACFIDFMQYESLHDSLEKVFNKFYSANIKKLVQDLKLNGINY